MHAFSYAHASNALAEGCIVCAAGTEQPTVSFYTPSNGLGTAIDAYMGFENYHVEQYARLVLSGTLLRPACWHGWPSCRIAQPPACPACPPLSAFERSRPYGKDLEHCAAAPVAVSAKRSVVVCMCACPQPRLPRDPGLPLAQAQAHCTGSVRRAAHDASTQRRDVEGRARGRVCVRLPRLDVRVRTDDRRRTSADVVACGSSALATVASLRTRSC